MRHDHAQFGIAGGHELFDAPSAICFAVICEDGTQSITLSERFPIILESIENTHEFPYSTGCFICNFTSRNTKRFDIGESTGAIQV